MCRSESARGLGLDGSNALRLVVEYPAKESATLGIMQPMCFPASQDVRRIRVHYRPDEMTGGRRDEVRLRLIATGLSLSGEYIDRAEIEAPAVRVAGQWYPFELNVENVWKRKHTRVDLIEFLEVAIEASAGPGAVFDYLIDNVELE